MSNTKTVMGQASNQYVAPLDITDVFSTYLYTGTGSAQTITNGIDLAGEGGMVWIKDRSLTRNHHVVDTERGIGDGIRALRTNLTDAEYYEAGYDAYEVTSANSDGFSLGLNLTNETNRSTDNYASWTFRKAPKFFTCLTYTGTGPASAANEQQVSHDLGAKPGIVIIKRTDATGDWWVFTDVIDGSNDYGYLNQTAAFGNSANNVATDSVFNVGGVLNTSGATYTAYLFANNDGDGEFGPDGDQDIIKCGSYSQSSASDVDVDLGFEPQFVIVKRSDDTSQWYILDEMRGFLAGSNSTSSRTLYASLANAEADFTIQKTATGFTWPSGQYGSGTQEYIYIAIRRGPLAQPESGTEVFAIDTGTGASDLPKYISNFPVDMAIITSIDAVEARYNSSRLTGARYLQTNTTAAESGTNANFSLDYNDGWFEAGGTNRVSWMWKRAPGFFDVVAYTGTNIPGLTINHNLGVVPEMIWVKNRSAAEYWAVYHKDLNGGTNPSHYYLKLNDTIAETDYNEIWNDTEPTATQFTVGQQGVVNGFEQNHIAYLFATVAGVSKVGSYTGNGTSQTIDCGFTSGARFVLIKGTSSSGFNWNVYDTARGIVAGNDSRLSLDTTFAEVSVDEIDPHSSGFSVTSAADVNMSGQSYIFYAIA